MVRKKKRKKFQKQTLTKKILVGFGIPCVFIPGLILASILGWNWKRDLVKIKTKSDYLQYERLFPKQELVVKIRDGDTIDLSNGRGVRLLGVNAPERGEDFYMEARDFTYKSVQDKMVDLEYGKYQEDKYGRLLAYVWVPEASGSAVKEMLNLRLVEEGLAKVVIYKDRAKLKYEDELLEMEEKAKRERRGIWE